MRKSISKIVKIGFIILGSNCAQLEATEAMYYGSVGLHQAEYDLGGIDESDSGLLSAHIGWSANDYISIEMGYQDFGDITISGNGSVKAEADAFQVSLIGRLPISEIISIYAEVGLDNWRGKIFINNVPGFGTFNIDGNGTDAFYGIGSEFRFTKNLNGFIEYHLHDLDGLEIDTIGIGVKYYVPSRF